jgi:hypothetical protein
MANRAISSFKMPAAAPAGNDRIQGHKTDASFMSTIALM